jgi:pimeloyl-ACP methyl ester carboxylesterase
VSDDVTSAMAAIVSDFHPRGFRLMARSLAENDTTSLLPTIRVPTLLLWGEADQRSPIDVAERFRDAIAHAELRIIPAAGHVSNMERPDAFTAHVRRFLMARK